MRVVGRPRIGRRRYSWHASMLRQSHPSAMPELGVDISTSGMYGVGNHSPTGYLLGVKQSGGARVTRTLEAPAELASKHYAVLGFVHFMYLLTGRDAF